MWLWISLALVAVQAGAVWYYLGVQRMVSTLTIGVAIAGVGLAVMFLLQEVVRRGAPRQRQQMNPARGAKSAKPLDLSQD